ncbi:MULTISPECIES: hypothetical protein [Actinoalloteichus]|uniref:Carboxypeptidase regulatory-like domain-containing protein n=1 Tax=Actinoalloteichus fjordicus TaxID=1612552 RepID=A0AAC9PPR0_9PSEU|nr:MULTISPECIES: hypothetical protein [Actinoalloteichus]APU12319.1 hypothetical protein UA74_01140 [Actinoalloteichus fjordicus]APU18271.1 hypothetical protein UA75_01140 [Actinoalloteichus sp. GBA129-24]
MAPRHRRPLAGAVLVLLTVVITAACSGGSDSGARPVSDTDTDTGSGVRTSATFQGRVETTTGAAVPGCLIVPTAVDGATEIPEMAVISDDEGAFTWTLPAGAYTFSTTCDSETNPDALAAHDGLSGTSDEVRADRAETTSVTIVVE